VESGASGRHSSGKKIKVKSESAFNFWRLSWNGSFNIRSRSLFVSKCAPPPQKKSRKSRRFSYLQVKNWLDFGISSEFDWGFFVFFLFLFCFCFLFFFKISLLIYRNDKEEFWAQYGIIVIGFNKHTMWVASPWGFSEMTIQSSRHECHACCPQQAGKPGIQPVVGKTQGTHVEQVVSSFQKILRGLQLTWYIWSYMNPECV